MPRRFTEDEDALILEFTASCADRKPPWESFASSMASKGFPRTANAFQIRYNHVLRRQLPGFDCVRKLMRTVMVNVKRRAAARKRGHEWQQANQDRSAARRRRHYATHKDEPTFASRRRAKDKRLRPASRARESLRYKTDPAFALKKKMRMRLHNYMWRAGIKKCRKRNTTMELVGCTPQELLRHLERQLAPGETMHGKHVDHIFPLSCYDPSELHRAMHWSNTQPLAAIDNLHKKDSLPSLDMAFKVEQWAWPSGIDWEQLPLVGWLHTLQPCTRDVSSDSDLLPLAQASP